MRGSAIKAYVASSRYHFFINLVRLGRAFCHPVTASPIPLKMRQTQASASFLSSIISSVSAGTMPPIGGSFASLNVAAPLLAGDTIAAINPNSVQRQEEVEAEVPDQSVLHSIMSHLISLQAQMDQLSAPDTAAGFSGDTASGFSGGLLPTDGIELAESLPVVPSYIAEKASRGQFIDLRLLFPPNLLTLPRTRVSDADLEKISNNLPRISSLSNWLEAFAVFSALVGRTFPEKVNSYFPSTFMRPLLGPHLRS